VTVTEIEVLVATPGLNDRKEASWR